MIKVLTVSLLAATSITALAHPPHGANFYYQQRYYGNSGDWVAPAILGGLVVYAATRPQVVAPPAPVVVTPVCGPWVEIRNPDGTVTQSRTCQ